MSDLAESRTGPAGTEALEPGVRPLVEVTGLTKHFDVSPPWLTRAVRGEGRTKVRAVDGVSFKIPAGRTFSLVGESGCGKSTVARLVVGLYSPTQGEVVFDGISMANLKSRRQMAPVRRRLQMIFQDPFASLNPRWRVADIVAEPIRAHGLLDDRQAVQRRVGELLEQVRLSARDGEKFPHEFSGGQRQRISIARALASNPEFLVCDEPTSALDVSVQAQILNLMKDLQRELGLTNLFISHDLAVVYHISDYVGVMYLGRLVEWGSASDIFRRPQHPYTRMLLDAIPDLEMSGRQRIPVAGEVPSPIHPPSGCHFHPRCPFANERCRLEEPPTIPSPAGDGEVRCHAVEERRLTEEVVQQALGRE
ncbi:MAG: ABC transporter ATP-binding protein [Tistlia sp.]